MNGVNCILFDFDGTLADTLSLVCLSFSEVFKHFDHKEMTNQEIISLFGPSESAIIAQHLESKHVIDSAIEYYYEVYSAYHKQYVKGNTYINDLLQELSRKCFKIGVVTGKGKRSLDISLTHLGMQNCFDVLVTSDDVIQPKPNPEGIVKALHALSCQPERSAFVGDSDADIVAGKAAGLLTVGVHWLKHFQTTQFGTRPDYYLTQVSDFQRMF